MNGLHKKNVVTLRCKRKTDTQNKIVPRGTIIKKKVILIKNFKIMVNIQEKFNNYEDIYGEYNLGLRTFAELLEKVPKNEQKELVKREIERTFTALHNHIEDEKKRLLRTLFI